MKHECFTYGKPSKKHQYLLIIKSRIAFVFPKAHSRLSPKRYSSSLLPPLALGNKEKTGFNYWNCSLTLNNDFFTACCSLPE